MPAVARGSRRAGRPYPCLLYTSFDALGDAAKKLADRGAVFICGSDPTRGLCGGELQNAVIFRSPGIRPDAGDIPEAVRRGALLTSEMEWFCDATPATVIAVTGSDGKTTTTRCV